jgi:hypothetical protein
VDPASDLDESVYEAIRFYYTYPLDQLSALPAHRLIVVKYEDLVREPKAVIEQIYRQFGLTMTPEFAASLDREDAKMRRHKSRHDYSLDECSVSQERILTDLRPIFRRFGFADGGSAGTFPDADLACEVRGSTLVRDLRGIEGEAKS